MFLALSGNGTLGAQIVAALRERILSGALPAGGLCPERCVTAVTG